MKSDGVTKVDSRDFDENRKGAESIVRCLRVINDAIVYGSPDRMKHAEARLHAHVPSRHISTFIA